jgi:hypothetical protein
MANFPTHIGVGALASGLLATLTLAADVVAPENVVAVTVAGVLGSVLPDIDLKDSRPGKALFSGLAAFFSFVALFLFVDRVSIAELWLIALAVFLLVRYVAHYVFHKMSYHRGIYHSILAGVFFALLTAVIYKHLLGRHEGVAWLAGGFMFIGYMVHLALDEIYSVDVMDTRIKASFGTAIKLIDARKPMDSLAMAVATAALFMVAPPSKTFVDGISSRPMWTSLQQRLWPKDKWFGIDMPMRRVAAPAALPAEPVAQQAVQPSGRANPAAETAGGSGAPASVAAPVQPPASQIETGTLPDGRKPSE